MEEVGPGVLEPSLLLVISLFSDCKVTSCFTVPLHCTLQEGLHPQDTSPNEPVLQLCLPGVLHSDGKNHGYDVFLYANALVLPAIYNTAHLLKKLVRTDDCTTETKSCT